jgi:hypothetical protein
MKQDIDSLFRNESGNAKRRLPRTVRASGHLDRRKFSFVIAVVDATNLGADDGNALTTLRKKDWDGATISVSTFEQSEQSALVAWARVGQQVTTVDGNDQRHAKPSCQHPPTVRSCCRIVNVDEFDPPDRQWYHNCGNDVNHGRVPRDSVDANSRLFRRIVALPAVQAEGRPEDAFADVDF